MALCGACTVHVDGQPVRACMTPISAVGEQEGHTIEAVGADKVGKAVQAAWVDDGRAAVRLLPGRADHVGHGAAQAERPSRPTPTSTSAMSGNICRCGTYTRIRAAIKQAAGQKGAMA